jgi:hypothetical protein
MRDFILSVTRNVFINSFAKFINIFLVLHFSFLIFSELHARLLSLLLLHILVYGHEYLHFPEALQAEMNVHYLRVVLRVD